MSWVTFAVTLQGCGASTSSEPIAAATAPPSAPEGAPATLPDATLAASGLEPGAMNASADPCSDFYQYSCGKWLEQTEIPADEGSWVRSFNGVRKRNEAELRRILESAAQASAGAEPSKLGTFYATCLDEPAVEAAGTKPIAKLLAKAAQIKDARGIAALTRELHGLGVWTFFSVSPVQDPKDATRWAAQLDQSGLGLPDRDYYLKQDEASLKLRATYLEHVQRMLVLAGRSEERARSGAADVLKIETALATSSKSRVERRDPKTMYNRRTRAEVARSVPAFAWDGYFNELGLSGAKEVYLTAPAFFDALQPILTANEPGALGSYLEWQIVRNMARHLSKAFVDESFKLEQALSGQAELRPRWRRCVTATTSALRDELGKAYVDSNFSPDSKAEAERLMAAISDAFGAGLAQLTWMDDGTRTRAAEKLAAMKYLIGYPDVWETYDFDVKSGDYAGNVLRARAFDLKRDLAKIGKPVDRSEWYIGAASVNAYYDAQLNHMAFPAGILQPPFYDPKSALPVNLGAIGIVLGHELTHGFDDEGSQFDAKGNLENWWTPDVRKHFEDKTSCVADQYGAYESLPGVNLDGRLTLGENIADLGGVKLAFLAYRALQGKAGAGADVRAGDQQFFLSVGQTWCAKYRPELARMLARVDPHSPPRFRLQGPLSNMPEFAQAFACPASAPMQAKNACSVW
jgi:putative endopeptidase